MLTNRFSEFCGLAKLCQVKVFGVHVFQRVNILATVAPNKANTGVLSGNQLTETDVLPKWS